MDPNLRLDMGFIGLAGIRNNTLFANYILRNTNDGFWVQQYVSCTYDHTNFWNNTPLSESATVNYGVNMKGPSNFLVSQTVTSREWWIGQEFEKWNRMVRLIYSGLNTALVRGSFIASYSQAKGIDYSRGTSDLEKTPQFITTFNAGPVYVDAEWMDRSIYDYATGALNRRATRLYLFVEQVLPHDFFWRVQYQPIRYYTPLATNPGMSVDTTWVKSVQYLGGWRPNPFSGFYVGYNQVRGTMPTTLDPRNEPVIEKGLFMKATYAFTL